ncbi:SMC family ATPase [Candidatus Woesearchaeota archaeon]|nr:SMC family ATPase [Candidatus Woesearchaeota archaeon]
MLLKSLKLQNIRSYLDEEISFPEGSVLLSGDIGAGKSTVLLAIEFALFGILRSDLSGTSLLRNGKNTGFVELTFRLENKEVAIKRTLKRTKDAVKQEAGQIIIGGAALDLTPQELKAKILELFGYPEELLTSAKSLIFRYTVYTPQEEMKKIIFDDEKERLNILRRVFGIDKYKRIVENSEIVCRRISEKTKILSEKITDLDEKKKQKESIGQQLSELKQNLNVLMPELEKQKSLFSEKKKNIEEKEAELKQFNEIRNRIAVLNTKLSEKEKQEKLFLSETEKLKIEIRENEARIKDVPKAGDNAEKEKEQLQEKYNSALEERASLNSKIADARERLDILKSEIDMFEKSSKETMEKKLKAVKLKEVLSGKEDLDNRIKAFQNSLDELKEESARKHALKTSADELKKGIVSMDNCPVCMQPIFMGQKKLIEENQLKKIDDFKKEISGLSLKEGECREQIKKLDEEIKKMAESEKELERIEGALQNSRLIEENYEQKQKAFQEQSKKVEEYLKTLSELKVEELQKNLEEQKKLLKQLAEVKSVVDSLAEKNRRLSEIGKSLGMLREEKTQIQTEQSEISAKLKDDSEKELAQARKELEELNEALKKIEMEHLSVQKDIENSNKIFEMLSKEVNEKSEVKKKIDVLKEKYSWLREKLVPLVKLIESHIMQAVYEEFDSHFRNWASVLLEDESINLRLDENFAPLVEQNSYFLDIADLSGEEKTSCALAYRLALNKVINDIMSTIKTKNLLILDEPTDGFSSEQLDKLRDVLEQINIPQTIIVSHEPKLESFVDNIIRISKSHHVSKVIS